MATTAASIKLPTEATALTPAPVKGTVELPGRAAEGEAAPDAWIWPSEICDAWAETVGNGAAAPVALAAELAGADAAPLVSTGPWPVWTTGVEAGADAGAFVGSEPEPAVFTHSHTALAEAWTAIPV